LSIKSLEKYTFCLARKKNRIERALIYLKYGLLCRILGEDALMAGNHQGLLLKDIEIRKGA